MCFRFFSLGNKNKSIFALFSLFWYLFNDLPEANKHCAILFYYAHNKIVVLMLLP